MVADYEGRALLARGFTGAALERYAELARDLEVLAGAEPDRADYQRDLSESYDRLGNLMGALGRGEEARASSPPPSGSPSASPGRSPTGGRLPAGPHGAVHQAT
jgi:hypothetical protein